MASVGVPLDAFEHSMRQLMTTRGKVEHSYQAGSLNRGDVEVIYSGLLIQTVNRFETFLDSTFHAICLGRLNYASKRRVAPRVMFRSPIVLREVVLGEGRDYVHWLPYGHTESRARVYLRGGRPFTEIQDHQRGHLKRVVQIRNAVAHSSAHSLRVFEDKVLSNATLLPHERRPNGYLRSLIGGLQGATQLEALVSQLRAISRQIAP